MTLIKSISGIRGTIGGRPNDGLSPVDIVKFTTAYAAFIRQSVGKKRIKIAVGRDARKSGEMVSNIVCGTLVAMGADVVDLGLSTTPTVEVAVPGLKADGGIILTASHNPGHWNALKLLNGLGEFISAAEGEWILNEAKKEQFEYVSIDEIGSYHKDYSWIDRHIQMVLDLPLVNKDLIANAGFRVVVDAVNSTGGITIPHLLRALGVTEVFELYCTPDGNFPHNPEPLPEHLTDLSAMVVKKKASLGFVVDPDVDRLAIVDENGKMFGEEYTLVAVADYILSEQKGTTVSNLSSTRALRDITEKHGCEYYASAVGEVNVVEMMKKHNAIIGGEGNGGIIYPELHFGRDALVGIALLMTSMAKKRMSCSELRSTFPEYKMSKNKISLPDKVNVDALLAEVASAIKDGQVNTTDGVKIDYADGWVHLRKSNTEPIIRVYAEAPSHERATTMADNIIRMVNMLTAAY
ncbi:MAG: phosphoglucosamine mutase [Bacteroidales bacterium]|nr:phosphoglucosamine mutase [Bacteroidales bacterium]